MHQNTRYQTICSKSGDGWCTKYLLALFPFSLKGPGGTMPPPPPTSISEPNKVQQFQFQTPVILLFTGVQNLHGLEISQFSPCLLQVLDNLRKLFIFSNYIGEIDHFVKSSSLWAIQKKTTMNESLNVRLYVKSYTYWENPLKQEKYPHKWSTIKYNSINTGPSENILK